MTVIRLATPMDLEAVSKLALAMRDETHWKDVAFTPDPGGVARWLLFTLATSPDYVLYVAEVEMRLIGFCLGVLSAHPFVPQVPIVCEQGWFVESAYRQSTIGMDLWAQVVAWGQTRGAKASIYSKPMLNGKANGKPHAIEVQMWQEVR